MELEKRFVSDNKIEKKLTKENLPEYRCQSKVTLAKLVQISIVHAKQQDYS